MRTIPALLGLALLPLLSSAQEDIFNMELVSNLDYQALHQSDVSDIWGYVDEFGNEYALVGVNEGGISVVSLADPSNPEEVFFFPGEPSTWRDLKVWNDHAYVTNEGGDGLAIIDLGPLPGSNDLTAANWTDGGWESAHNIHIDENGVAYIFGANRGDGGVIFLDLDQDPFSPVELGEFDTWYVHDGMARGDTLYLSHVNEGFFSIVDVSDKSAPALLGTQFTGNTFTHNCWVSDDGQYLFTTDEVTGGFIGSYDISDPSDIQTLQQVRSEPGSGTIPHNTHYKSDGYIVTSYYRLGTTIHDVSRPDNVVEVARYDHSPLEGSGFNGGWGTYPWLPSGLIISSDIEGGLFVFQPQYVRACWLEGQVTDAQTSLPVNQAVVTLVETGASDQTGLTGRYGTGHYAPGTFSVQTIAQGYETLVIEGVQLETGEVTLLDIQLQALVPFTLTGQVVDAQSGDGIAGAQLLLESIFEGLEVTCNAEGFFSIADFLPGAYAITAGQWGWRTSCTEAQQIDADNDLLVIELEPGYYDDFVFDFGWSVTSTATLGMWERGNPAGTNFQGAQSNPGSDVDNDCGAYAWVTGNAGGSAGADDVDDGWTLLTSPIFDATGPVNPGVRYHRWFFNAGGDGQPNDEMIVSLTNGMDTAVVELITPDMQEMSQWVFREYPVLDHLDATADMRILIYVEDDDPGHLVEGAFDLFELVELSSVSIEEVTKAGFLLWPNPGRDAFTLQPADGLPGRFALYDLQGRLVMAPQQLPGEGITVSHSLRPGTYLVHVTDASGRAQMLRLVVG